MPERAGILAIAWEHENGAGHDEQVLFDTSVAHCARVYDYWLGGKDNFAADRVAAEQAIRDFPDIVPTARANRASWPGPCGSWPKTPGSGSSSTSAPAFPPRTTPTRSPSWWRPAP